MRKVVICSALAMSLLVTGAVFAKTDKTIVARKAAGTVTIDGDLKEFLSPAPTGNEIGVMDTTVSALESGAIDSNADWSNKFYALYDANSLYIGIDVTDDVIAGSASGGDIWKNDTVELWFDADYDDEDSTECGSAQSDQHQVGITIATEDTPGQMGHMVWRSQSPDAIMDGIKYAGKVGKTGYTIEAKINWADLNGSFKTVKAGQKVGFNMSFVDNDEGDWNHITWSGTQHNNPQGFGSITIK